MLTYLVLEEGQPLQRIPISVVEDLLRRRASIPQFASRTVRVAEVRTADGEDGGPEEVIRIVGARYQFDAEGFLNEGSELEEAQFLGALMSDAFKIVDGQESKVVSLEERAKLTRLKAKFRWDPTPAESQAICKAALGHPRAVKNVKSTKHKPVKEPTATYRSYEAVEKAERAFHDLDLALSFLEEDDLRGLLPLLQKKIDDRLKAEDMWKALLRAATHRIEMIETRRSGSGEWYAILEIIRWDERNVGETAKILEEKFATRDVALKRTREMIAHHATEMRADTTFEARVVSALEWEDERE